jgi:DNA-binding IclR family transcriptional regulator
MKKSGNSKYHVPNLERALNIIELLAEHPEGLTVTHITDDLKIPRNSVFRITATLLDNGYISRDDDTKVFQLSQKLLNLGYAAIGEQSLIEKSLGNMRALRDKFGETVPLGILHGAEGIVIEEVPGTHSFRFVLEPGRKFHLHTSAPAKAIVAFLSEEEREDLITKIKFEKYNERTITSPFSYRSYLTEVRQKGYAIDHAEEIEGMHCVGAPIFNQQGYPIAAIWISGPSMRLETSQLDQIGVEVKKYADNISNSLGYSAAIKSTSKNVSEIKSEMLS